MAVDVEEYPVTEGQQSMKSPVVDITKASERPSERPQQVKALNSSRRLKTYLV